MSKNVNNQMGYAGKVELKDVIKSTKNFTEEMKEKEQELNALEVKIEGIEEEINSISDKTKANMKSVSKKISDYVKILQSYGEGKTDTSFTDKLTDFDSGELYQDKLPEFEEFLNNKYPIEESHYNSNYVLSNNYELINVDFHTKARESDFLNHPFDDNWYLYQKDCVDKCIVIPIDNNIKSFEFGIKYNQILSNNIKQERFYTGKILVTGLINNYNSENIIPTEVKAIIYNGDLDPVFTPEFNFKFYKDKSNLYIYLDEVFPLRLLPLLDISTRKVYPHDIFELNSIKPENLNLYIDNDTLYDSKPISLNYFINFSLLDTTKYSNNKTTISSLPDLSNLDFINNLTIKSDKSYRNLIGFDYHNTSPINKEISFSNYNTINKTNIINTLTPSKVKYKINDKYSDLVNKRQEAFRRITVLANPKDSNYFYVTLEENLDYMISLNTNIHRSQNMNYATYPNVDHRTTYWVDYIHGKYKGKSCIVTSNYYTSDTSSANFYNDRIFIITNYTNKNKNSIHTITFGSPYYRTIPNWRKKFIFYDDYTEYFYICFYPTTGNEGGKSYNVRNIYARTKDFVTYEEFDTSDKLSKTQDVSNLWYFNNMETDNNGRFILSYYNTDNSLTILIYDISPNDTSYSSTNKIKPSKVINLPQVFNGRTNYNILYSTKNSIWFISSNGYNYYYSIDNGNTWINNRIKQPTSDNRAYYHLGHDKDFTLSGSFGFNQMSQITRMTENPYYSNDGVGISYRQASPYELYQDLDHNGKMLMSGNMRADGFTRVTDFHNIGYKSYGCRKNTNVERFYNYSGYWDGREFIGNVLSRDHYIPMRDQENDIYIDAMGTKGLMTWNYNMDMGIWVVNRLYRVNKSDYTMVEITNMANSGKVLTTMNGRREATDITGWKTAPVRPISQHNGRNSDANLGLYDGYANKVNMPDFYNYYDKQTGKLRFYQYTINKDSISVSNWSTADYGSGKVPDNYNIFTYNEKLKIRLGSINKTTNKYGTIVCSKNGGTWKKIFQYSSSNYNVLTTGSTHEIDKSKTFNNTTYNAFIIDDKLYLLGSHALDIITNINFDADLVDGNSTTAACGYEAGDFTRKKYPWVTEYESNQSNYSRQIDVLGSPNWAYMSYYDEKRRKIVFFLDESLNSINRTGIFKKSVIGCTYKSMAYNSHYDGKYWKGIMVYDIDKEEFTYNGCLFGKLGYTGDLDDIDYIDFFDVIWTNATLDMSSHIGEDEKGTYLVSPKTGNIYRLKDDTWLNFEKEECDFKLSQIVKNDVRNSYVYFLNNNLMDFMKNKFAIKGIREIPLVVTDRKITKDKALELKNKVINSIKEYQKNMNSNIMFKTEIVISLPPTDRTRTVRLYEVGSYNGNQYMIFRYLIDNYTYSDEFEKNNGYPLKSLNTDQNLYKHYNMIDRTLYNELRGIDLKLSQKINEPLINLDSLLVHPTEINITFFPTEAEVVNVDYKVSRNINKIPYNDELSAYVEVLDKKGYTKSVEYKSEKIV